MYSISPIVVLSFFLNEFLIFCLSFWHFLGEKIVVIAGVTDGVSFKNNTTFFLFFFFHKDDKFMLFTDTGYFPFIYMWFHIVHCLHSVFILSALI